MAIKLCQRKPYALEKRVENEFERLGGIIQCSTPWTKNDLIHGKQADYIIMDDLNEPPKPTKFWECEYCGTVNPIDLLDCRGKACGHSITRKAMEAAFDGPKTETPCKPDPTGHFIGIDYGYGPDVSAIRMEMVSDPGPYKSDDKMDALRYSLFHRIGL